MTDTDAFHFYMQTSNPDLMVNPRTLMYQAWNAALQWERANAVQRPGEATSRTGEVPIYNQCQAACDSEAATVLHQSGFETERDRIRNAIDSKRTGPCGSPV